MRATMRCSPLPLLALSLVGCPRATPTSPPRPVAPDVSAQTAAPVDAAPPSADALVLVPGEGFGAFSLGMTRTAAVALGEHVRELGGPFVNVDGFELRFSDETPTGQLVSVQSALAPLTGGVRVGDKVLSNGATWRQVVDAVGPCEAPQQNDGGEVTVCQGGALRVMRAGPTQTLMLGVARR